MIDITGVDLRKFVAEVYNLSKPQGLGFLHFKEGSLSEEEIDEIVNAPFFFQHGMDYIKGRACKMGIYKKEDKLFIQDTWYDHTHDQLQELFTRCGLNTVVEYKEHGIACNCSDCQSREKKSYDY